MNFLAYFMNFQTKFAMPSDARFSGVTPFSNSGPQDDIACLGGNFYKSSFATATGRLYTYIYMYIFVCVS